jgi:SAM-dependent methyltransferase
VANSEQEKTADAFGYQWTHFTQMHDTFKAQFLDWVFPIPESFFKDKIVLDAGCGIGRHMFYAAEFGAREIIGLDISEAAETCHNNFAKNHPRAHVVQADLTKPPFPLNTFDFVYSIGVLHHTPQPETGFQALVKTVKRGGTMFAWVYGHENNGIIHYFIDPLRKNITTHMPYQVLRVFAFILAVILHAMLKLVYRPLNKLGLKFLPYNDYFYQLSGFNFDANYTIVFDHLVPTIAFYIKQEDFRAWFERAKLKDVEISWRNKNSWRGRGVVSES